jgi:Glu-tRNA(Gln) amidotransferase subunit E-like FAD-binding protein
MDVTGIAALAAAAAPSNDMTTEIIIAVLGAGGVGAILAAIIAGLFSKRKLGAEATEIITKAAAGVVTNLQDELIRQQGLVTKVTQEAAIEHARLAEQNQADRQDAQDKMKEMAESHALEIEEVRRVLQLHVAWDAIAIAKMAEKGIDLPPAPPLLPARRFDHPQP